MPKVLLFIRKHKARQKTIAKLKLDNGVEITNQEKILKECKKFYERLYKSDETVCSKKLSFFYGNCNIPKLDAEKSIDWSNQKDFEFTYEVGIAPEFVTIVREFTDVYIPPSNFLATPFVGYAKVKPVTSINHEVAHTIDIRLADLLDDTNISSTNITTSYANKIDVPCFELNNYIVWGATAMILSEIKDLLK